MAQLKNIWQSKDVPWIRLYQDYLMARTIIKIEDHGIWITDFINWEDNNDKFIAVLILKLKHDIKWYLNELWC
jgi:hypothetical protein